MNETYEDVYKVEINNCDALKESAYSENTKQYISLDKGYIIVKKHDLPYIWENYKVLSIQYLGKLCELHTK